MRAISTAVSALSFTRQGSHWVSNPVFDPIDNWLKAFHSAYFSCIALERKDKATIDVLLKSSLSLALCFDFSPGSLAKLLPNIISLKLSVTRQVLLSATALSS